MDGVHPTHNVQPAYGWIEIGVRKEVPANSGRSRINLSGAIDMHSYKIVVQEDKMLYECFEGFRSAVFGFFEGLSKLDPESVLGQNLRSRVRDKFTALNCPKKACA